MTMMSRGFLQRAPTCAMLMFVTFIFALLHTTTCLPHQQRGLDAATKAALWPLPVSVSYGSDTVQLPSSASDFTFVQAGSAGQSAVLAGAFTRYMNIIYAAINGLDGVAVDEVAVDGNNDPFATMPRPAARVATSMLSGVDVYVTNPFTPLDFGVNETYSLVVTSPRAKLYADTVWGAMHGLETFSQLVQVGADSQGDDARQVWDAPVEVWDYPRFPHRGLLLDTSRHYLPVKLIQHAIDALSYNKMNVAHLHLVDAQSFPVNTTVFPELAGKGAYTPYLTYSATDLAGIVAYGNARGVRVLPEFDVPGHAYAWGLGYPNITATCPGYAANINNIPLNPCNDFTFDVMKGLIGEMAGVFSDSFFHVGGDEVVYGCWEEDPSIQQCVKDRGYSSYNDVMQYFVTRNDGYVLANKKTPIHWNDVFDEGIKVDPSTVFQVWTSHAVLQNVLRAGYRAILSNSNAWYLNCGFNPGCAYISWQAMYENDIFANVSVTPAQRKLVIGGEAALWSSYSDRTNWDPQVWPRNSAVAERLWSEENITSVDKALPRLVYHRCRMVSRGILASPITTGYCPRVFP